MNIPYWETHWFQLKENSLLRLKDNLLQELIKKAIKKAGNLNKLTKELKLSYPSFLYVLRKQCGMVSVKKLKKLADFLNIKYSYFNDKIIETKKGKVISIQNPKFPFNLKNKEGSYLLGCIVSDGTIYIDKKARNVLRTKYSSSDKESTQKFIKNIEKIFGKVHIQKEIIRGNTYLKIGSSIVGDSLIKAGAILGNKTKNNGPIPLLIKENPELSKYYLNAVFGNEGSSAGRNYFPYINLTRCNRINALLTKKEIIQLDKFIVPIMKTHRFPTGHIIKSVSFPKIRNKIDKKVYNKLSKKGISTLLLHESQLLNKLGIETKIHIKNISKTQLGFYSLSSTLFISRKKSLLKFYKEVGFSLTRKQEKLKNSLMEVDWLKDAKII